MAVVTNMATRRLTPLWKQDLHIRQIVRSLLPLPSHPGRGNVNEVCSFCWIWGCLSRDCEQFYGRIVRTSSELYGCTTQKNVPLLFTMDPWTKSDLANTGEPHAYVSFPFRSLHRPCHSSGCSFPVSHCGGPGSSPGYLTWDLWWTVWHEPRPAREEWPVVVRPLL
jgi:hypothetical protein